jgi:hypothetical protein
MDRMAGLAELGITWSKEILLQNEKAIQRTMQRTN